MQVTQK